MRRRSFIAAAASAAAFASSVPHARTEETAVDVLLILAVDVSRSTDEEEARMQRDGYASAMVDPRLTDVIRVGAIGVCYMEWSGDDWQRVVMPWRLIAERSDAEAWAEALMLHTPRAIGWTSISGAIDMSRRLFAQAPWEATRRVVDISGDGTNNSGRPAQDARDEAVAEGITINGLPILSEVTIPGSMPLDEYYKENVIGGPGSFVVVADDFRSFARAVRRKLILEIAGTAPDPINRGFNAAPWPRA